MTYLPSEGNRLKEKGLLVVATHNKFVCTTYYVCTPQPQLDEHEMVAIFKLYFPGNSNKPATRPVLNNKIAYRRFFLQRNWDKLELPIFSVRCLVNWQTKISTTVQQFKFEYMLYMLLDSWPSIVIKSCPTQQMNDHSVQDIISVKDLHFTEDGCEVGEDV